MKPNLIIVDDHQMFLEGILFMLEKESRYHVLAVFNDGQKVIDYISLYPETRLDLLITDISMPGIGGVALNKAVKENNLNTKVLVVSMHYNLALVNTLIKDKVDGIVPKCAGRKELINAIDTVLSGGKHFSEQVRNAYAGQFFDGEQPVIDSISDKEKEILKLIALEHTTKEISDIMCLSKHTIDTHRKNLIVKLDVRNMAGLVKYALKLGLIEA